MRVPCFLFCVLALPFLAAAQSISLQADSPTNPVVIKTEKETLHPFDGIGPVFSVNGGDRGPKTYKVSVKEKKTTPGGMELLCVAASGTWSAEYTLDAKVAGDTVAIDLKSAVPVAGVAAGRLTGASEPVRSFYLGEREAEAYPGNETDVHTVYVPSAGLYLRAAWDLDRSHAAGLKNLLPVWKNYSSKNPPLTVNLTYDGGSQGEPPLLNERLTLKVGKGLWPVFAAPSQKPSEYRDEIGRMLYIDLWDDNVPRMEGFLKWFAEATGGYVPFLTIIQVWGERGFDGTLPDLFRVPDHMKQQNSTLEELESLVGQARRMGRVGLRNNYMWIKDGSWSVAEKAVTFAEDSGQAKKAHVDFGTILPLIEKQEADIVGHFKDNARFSDQVGSGGEGWPYVQFQKSYPGRATISGVRNSLREFSRAMKTAVKGPLLTETMNGDFLWGEFCDAGDFGIMGAHIRNDFTPEYKLRLLHPLTPNFSMGLGYRFYNPPSVKDWFPIGAEQYFGGGAGFDDYRACQVLYGNGAYLFWYPVMKKSQALTEALTVGLAQPYYTLSEVDSVSYGREGEWATLEEIIPNAETREDVDAWFRQFHIRYKNGCHVWVNRSDEDLDVKLPGGSTLTLPKYGFVVYTEDGQMLCYSAYIADPNLPSNRHRIDFCEDKSRGLKYINPRNPTGPIMGATVPTFWAHGTKVYELTEDENFEN